MDPLLGLRASGGIEAFLQAAAPAGFQGGDGEDAEQAVSVAELAVKDLVGFGEGDGEAGALVEGQGVADGDVALALDAEVAAAVAGGFDQGDQVGLAELGGEALAGLAGAATSMRTGVSAMR